MDNNALQLTIREITQQATSPKLWISMLGIVCILTVSAPFSTDTYFNSIQRFFYWGSIAVSTYFCASFVLLMVLRKLRQLGKSEIFSRVVASLVSALTVAAVVIFINSVVVGTEHATLKDFVLLGANCILIALAVDTLFFLINDSLEKVNAAASKYDTPVPESIKTPSPFYQRLSKSLGTDVISLQAQDHYVDVKTTLGNELILIRLSDAIKELGEDDGVQVHRSWWVAKKHMEKEKRVDNKPSLVLSDQTVVPVSRTYRAQVTEALS